MPKSEAFALWHYFPLLLLLFYSSFPATRGGDSEGHEVWCVARNNAEDAALQAAMDWACSAGGADCSAVQGGGPCYDASSVQNTASYAFNDYFRKHGVSEETCNFGNNAAITSLDPIHLAVSNGSFSGSASSMGWRPGEDTSGCCKVAWRWWWWFWPFFIIGHSLLIVSVSFSWIV